MKETTKRFLIASVLTFSTQHATAITIEFDYSYDSGNFFDTQAKKDILETAGSYFSNVLQDTLDPLTSSGINSFNAQFDNPSNGNLETINSYSVAADTLIVFAGGRALAGTTLGQGGPGGFTASGSTAFFDSIRTRGEAGVDPNNASNSADFAPWGGAITFDNDGSTSWYFDTDLSTSNDVVGNDFFSVALHELGHLLGVGTSDSWNNLISGSDFTGAASSSVFGANVPLENSGHWLDGTIGLVDGISQETAMDPTILTGTRKVFTDLDLAGLTDIGWEVTAVPVPAALWLFVSGLMGIVFTGRRRS